jgi:hypothetical protein
MYVKAVLLSTGLNGKKWTSLIPALACTGKKYLFSIISHTDIFQTNQTIAIDTIL